MRVVFDTNVIVSAWGWDGAPRRCLQLARQGHVEGYTCLEILDEVAEVLERKLSLPPETAVQVVEDLLGFLRVVPITGSLRVVDEDPDDDKVVECALNADASHVVSGDRHLLSLKRYGKVSVSSPAELLLEVSSVPGADSS